MKKIFLIPLLACFSCVMAWGVTRTAGTAAELRDAISAASDGDVIELTADIAYGSDHTLININKSITLDGKGHKITGYGMRDRLETAINDQSREVVVVINHNAVASGLNVTIKNLKMIADQSAKYVALMVYDGVNSLTLDNCEITSTSGYPFVMYGETQAKLNLTMDKTTVNAGSGMYAVLLLRPINATISNSTFEGYCTWYILPPFSLNTNQGWGKRFGTLNSGARGSVISADNCYFYANNVHSGATNEFGCFVFEEDGITLNLNNIGVNAESLGDAGQAMLLFNNWGPIERHLRKVEVNMSGDNTHVNGQFVANYWYSGYDKDASVAAGASAFKFRFENGGLSGGSYEPEKAYKGVYYKDSIYVNISGGTYSMNPDEYQIVMHLADKYFTEEGMADVNLNVQPWNDGEGGCKVHDAASVEKTYTTPTIAAGYEVATTKQGTITLYRVVKKAAKDGDTPLYNLNDNVETAGNGQNPVTSFELSKGGEPMELNQPTTKAGYVQIKDNATDGATTVKVGKVVSEEKVNQTLVINNGLDVQGNSKVEVQAGSTLEIGEGGITTEKPENIVIGADETGAASLLLDPTITVNQTPNLTVKMKAKQIGWETVLGTKSYFWHRFALPIQRAEEWVKNPNKSTYVFGWNYSNDSWEQLSALTQMVPFKGYTLSADYEHLGDVEYTFTGQLAGNTNNLLEFERNGFNFFGNSYTGYINVLALLDQLMGDSKIDGTVWMWGSDQNYHAVPLQALQETPGAFEAWQKEVAPMQTFILKQNGSTNATTELNYASAIWGNPRYGHSVTPAPSRNIADETTRMRIIVTAENGKSDFVMFTEGAKFSDSFEKGYDGEKYMNENALNMFATVNGANYTAIATDNLEGKMITINTVEAVNYTMSFAKVNGEEYAIRDNVTGKVIAIQEGASYEFAAQPNSTVEGRFQIVTRDQVTTAIENTEVKANVKGIYTLMGQYVGEDFNTLPAGVYVVDGVKIVK